MNGSYFRAFMDLLNKPKLDIDKQIDLLKSRGVKFIIDSERVAKQFLQNNTYFYKSEFDYLYDTAYDKSRSYFVITEIDDDPFIVDINREYIVH